MTASSELCIHYFRAGTTGKPNMGSALALGMGSSFLNYLTALAPLHHYDLLISLFATLTNLPLLVFY